ncbi:MAG TPA: SCO family protein [Ktedonobacteraceae bacterium]|nr:SCO family protein [Ktedonobacteraceae bacterium]
MTMSWRLASRLSVVTLALLVVLVVAILSLRNSTGETATPTPSANQSGLQGTDLGSVPAPDFHLKDQFGKPVSLSQFIGKPVVVTFLYTHCPDVCPLIAEKLHAARLALGSDASRVVMLAISVDPKGDTQTTALNFSQTHKMADYWHYLIGTREQLAPVWSAYAIDAQTYTATTSTHTSAVYVIDKQGRERVLLDQDFTTTQLVNNLKILLKE